MSIITRGFGGDTSIITRGFSGGWLESVISWVAAGVSRVRTRLGVTSISSVAAPGVSMAVAAVAVTSRGAALGAFVRGVSRTFTAVSANSLVGGTSIPGRSVVTAGVAVASLVVNVLSTQSVRRFWAVLRERGYISRAGAMRVWHSRGDKE